MAWLLPDHGIAAATAYCSRLTSEQQLQGTHSAASAAVELPRTLSRVVHKAEALWCMEMLWFSPGSSRGKP